MRSEIEKIFQTYINKTFSKQREICRFLRHHPRRDKCIDNLCREIALCERKALQISFDSKAYVSTIQAVARMFCDAALKYAEERALTSNERGRRVALAQADENIIAMTDEWKREGALIERDRTKEISDGQAKAQTSQD